MHEWKLKAEKTTGKYSFLDLSPFNNDLKVGGTCDLCVFATTHLGIYPNPQVQSKNCLVEKLVWIHRVIQYLYVLKTHLAIENMDQYIHLKTRSLFEWNLLTDTVFASCMCQVLLNYDCTSYVYLQGCFQQQAAPHTIMSWHSYRRRKDVYTYEM